LPRRKRKPVPKKAAKKTTKKSTKKATKKTTKKSTKKAAKKTTKKSTKKAAKKTAKKTTKKTTKKGVKKSVKKKVSILAEETIEEPESEGVEEPVKAHLKKPLISKKVSTIKHGFIPTPKIWPNHLTKYERSRIIGARALQISMGAPILIEELEKLANPVEVAEKELEFGILPLTIRRIFPNGEVIDVFLYNLLEKE